MCRTVCLFTSQLTLLYQIIVLGNRHAQRRTRMRHNAAVTMTTEVGTDSATTLSRMNLSGYVGHVTIFSSMFTIACCLVAGLGLGLGLGLNLVSGW